MDLLLSPLSWILVAALWLPAAIRTRQRRRLGFACCVLLGLAGLLGAMPLGANLLVGPLESDASQETGCTMAAPATIVTLAGGADREAVGASDFERLNLASLRRVIAAVALWRTQPGRMLIFSGGSPFAGMPAESSLMGNFAVALGVPAGAIQVETTSTTTWGNARGVAALTSRPRRIWLVTSALHMRRARFSFAHAGFEVCPYPTDRRLVAFGLPGYLVPQAGAALKSEQALHEWVGLAYYRWLAWHGG
jgi:uncharacterized SAM-binding protein YcdF (DUF218 family)